MVAEGERREKEEAGERREGRKGVGRFGPTASLG